MNVDVNEIYSCDAGIIVNPNTFMEESEKQVFKWYGFQNFRQHLPKKISNRNPRDCYYELWTLILSYNAMRQFM